MFTYDPQTRELRVVVEQIREVEDAVANVYWDVDEGECIRPGTRVARIEWNGRCDTPIVAPEGCEGTIAFVNRNVLSSGGGLVEYPAKVLVRLE